MYEDRILDHAENPFRKCVPPHYTHEAEDTSPICGDRIRFMLDVHPATYQITYVGWDGEGCVLCLAAASILAEYIDQRGLNVCGMTPEQMKSLLKIDVPRSREGCILLPMRVLQNIHLKENR